MSRLPFFIVKISIILILNIYTTYTTKIRILRWENIGCIIQVDNEISRKQYKKKLKHVFHDFDGIKITLLVF